MNFRPQIQLRFRNLEQFELVKALAAADQKSVNEWILVQIEKESRRGRKKRGPSTPEVR